MVTSCSGPVTPSATADLPEPATSDPCAADQQWSAHLTVSGGFAGIQRTIAVDAGGALTATDAREGSSRTRVLPSGDLGRLRSLLASACPFSDPGPLPTCADCFDYRLDVSYRSGIARVELNDISLTGSGYDELIRELIELGKQP